MHAEVVLRGTVAMVWFSKRFRPSSASNRLVDAVVGDGPANTTVLLVNDPGPRRR